MKKLPEAGAFEELAIELGVDPSFVEKDWYATELLVEIAKIDFAPVVFTGGTSLSKAYGLIQRFSEDLDFRICTSGKSYTKSERKAIRERILAAVETIPGLAQIKDSLKSQNESQFFSFNMSYPQSFAPTDALRPHLKLEFTFEDTLTGYSPKDIRSLVSQVTESGPDCSIQTISAIEIAANKFSALVWRINIKDRQAQAGSTQNDPTIMRHLHDLAALLPIIEDENAFRKMVAASFLRDQGRNGSDKEKSLEELSLEALHQMKVDAHYAREYKQFVDAMSYAPEDERIGFDDALALFEEHCQMVFHP